MRPRKTGQAARLISMGRLKPLRVLHLPPIDVVISDEPSGGLRHGIPRLGVCFALRGFQRLSHPNIATRRCSWRNNRYTRGSFAPLLSHQEQLPASILRPRWIGTELSHDVLNPAHVPIQCTNSPNRGTITCSTLQYSDI